ncbi:MAG: L-threonylcarbamoyladenylate synthase [Gemmatimonas sp.]
MALFNVDPIHPEPSVIQRAADILRAGGLVAFPTETVYGLGANALDANAVARIFEAKARPAWNPVIAHVNSVDEARALTATWPAVATALATAFWPGPLTLVLPKNRSVPDIVSAGLPAVALRIPQHPVARALIAALGAPIAAPSANRFTELSPTTAAHVQESLGDRVDMILNGGPSDVGIESTVVDVTGNVPVLLRPGVISRGMLANATGMPISLVLADARDNTPRLSPGMVERHYAPRAAVWLFAGNEMYELQENITKDIPAEPGRVAALVLDWSPLFPEHVRVIRMPNDPLAYARMLYATLHDLDQDGFTVIAIERPPQNDAWAGIHDRLNRAAH